MTNKAVKDLSIIWNYTMDNCLEKQADKYYEEIISECIKISKILERGRKYFDLIKDMRGAIINRHIIFYREIGENVIEVERILHQRMDLKSRLG